MSTLLRSPGFVVPLAVVLVPMVVAIVELSGRRWTPAGDIALEMLQVAEVGTEHTPLTGAWSRWGWNHPGPLLFYALAPFTWLFGNVGALIGVTIINMLACAAAVWLGWRRGGTALASLVALVVVGLAFSLTPEVWISPWNPWVGLLPLFALVLMAWSLAERDLAVLPWVVGVGSFVVQAHVGFAPVVVGVVLAGGALGVLWRRAIDDEFEGGRLRPSIRRLLLASVVTAAVL